MKVYYSVWLFNNLLFFEDFIWIKLNKVYFKMEEKKVYF